LGEITLVNGSHVCDVQETLLSYVRSLVSKLGGEATLENELLEIARYLAMEITTGTDTVTLKVIGQPFGNEQAQ